MDEGQTFEDNQLSDEDEELTRQILELKACEQWYKSGPNNYRMLELWRLYNVYVVAVPGWLQEKIDKYLYTKLKNERSRYKRRNIKQILCKAKLIDIFKEEVRTAVNKAKSQRISETVARAKTIKKIASREGVTERTVRNWINPKQKNGN